MSITVKTAHDTKERPTSHQRWLQMQIKWFWKPAGVLAQPPDSTRGEDGRLVVKDYKWAHCICNIIWLNDEGQQLWHPCHSSPNVALTQSLKIVNYRNLTKQLLCQSANSTFESCWPASWAIWENKLDICFQKTGQQQQAEAIFLGFISENPRSRWFLSESPALQL